MDLYAPDQERPDMMARRAAGMKLISDEIALEIARLVLIAEHGEAELKRQSPLTVKGEGDTWVVRGSVTPVETVDLSKYEGPYEMRISQFTGQIFGCSFLYFFPRQRPQS